MPWDMHRLTVREYRALAHYLKQEQERLNGL